MDSNKIKVKKILRKQSPKCTHMKSSFNWIDRCYEETMFSNPSWDMIQNKIGKQLSSKLQRRIEEDLKDEISQQILFSLLGKNYMEDFLPSYSVNPAAIESHKLSESELDQLIQKVKKLIEIDTMKSYEELGYSNLSINEIREYRNHVEKQFSDALEKKLKENKSKNKRNREEPIEIIGKALMKILHRNPQSISAVIVHLKDQVVPMPNTLRKCIYVHQLIKKAEKNDDSIKRDVLELKKKLRSYLAEVKVTGNGKQLIRSNEWKKIDKDVIDVYHSTPGMKGIDTDEHLMTSSRVLNLLQKANKCYKKSLIYWLCPFLLAFESHASLLRDDAVVEVTALFDLVDRFLIPTHAQIFTITHKAVDMIVEKDRNFYNHLSKTMKINPRYHGEDFSLEVLHIDKEKAKRFMNELKSDPNSPNSFKIMVNPQIYMRRWVADGFLQNLRLEGALFIWDQLFYSKWEPDTVQKAVLVVMMLLKPWFMRAENYGEVRKVFLDEPGRLYTVDIRRAWRHLNEAKNIYDIAEMNRNILQLSETPPPPPAVYKPPPAAMHKPPPPLPAPVIVPPTFDSSSDSETESESSVESLTPEQPESDSESEDEPEPEPEYKPEVKLDEREDIYGAWLPFDKRIKSELPKPSRMNAPFDLYIDAVRFLPDNATVVKVTGKIINTGDEKASDSPDIIAYSDLKSPGKRPEFKFKLPIRGEQVLLNPEVLLLLRVYTVEMITNELVIVGSCLFKIFKNKSGKPIKLQVGGHQIRLRRGFPKNKDANLSADDMNENLPIPSCTILIRLLPHSEKFVEMPDYSTHYYKSKHSFPTESECNIYKDYMKRQNINLSVTDILKLKLNQAKVNDSAKHEAFMKKILERKKNAQPRQISLDTLINYNKEFGIALLTEEAHRLPVLMSGKFFHVLLQMLPGKSTAKNCKTFSVMTEKLELESSHLDPNWMDAPTKVNPEYDEKSVLFIQIYGLQVDYSFPEKSKPGTLKAKDGKEFNLNLSNPLAWTVIPLFKNGVVNIGTFLAPLIKHHPTKKLIQAFQTETVEKSLKSMADEIKYWEGSSIEISLWDGHFVTTECPPITKTNHLIKLTPKPSKFLKAINAKNETSFIDLLVNKKVLDEGPEAWLIGSDTSNIQEDFLKLFNVEFEKLMSHELGKRKLNPLSKGGVDNVVKDESDESESDDESDED